MDGHHVSVMLRETLEWLRPPAPDSLMVDATLGLAGHSAAFLERYPSLRLWGVDADAEVQAIARARLSPYGDRVRFANEYFDDFFGEFRKGGEKAGVVLFDFGLSMYHFRESRRGFSLQGDEQLDMRLDPGTGRPASALVNGMNERELAKLLEEYGEEPFAWRIAQAIVRERKGAPIESTGRLADIIRGAVPAAARHGRIHPATRSFQAFRIAVNDELGRIRRALDDAIESLAPGGVVGAISFHSLEDRIVKLAFRERAVRPERGRFKDAAVTPIPLGEVKRGLLVLTKKPLEPGEDEVSANPASRSAKFRVAKAAD